MSDHTVEPRPWWATRSWFARLFVVASIVGLGVGVFAPIMSQREISRNQQALEQSLAQANQRIEDMGRKVEVSRLLFDHYFGKPTAQQTAVITYLRFQFPAYLSDRSVKSMLGSTAKPETKKRLTE